MLMEYVVQYLSKQLTHIDEGKLNVARKIFFVFAQSKRPARAWHRNFVAICPIFVANAREAIFLLKQRKVLFFAVKVK